MRYLVLAAVLAMAVVAPVAAQIEPPAAAAEAATLTVGKPAPALAIGEWVKGSQVAAFEKGKVYVVEFWATWCGPCKVSIPHLSELQNQYRDKDVTIIGVTSEDPRNKLSGVQKMVTNFGEKMNYTVAWDRGRTTSASYMKASGSDTIPTAFVVDKEGRIAFIGHPSELDPVIPAVLDGTWDLEAAAKVVAEKAAARKLADEFMEKIGTEDYSGAQSFAAKAAEGPLKESADILNIMAWTIVDPQGPIPETLRDNALALKLATRANELTKDSDPVILDTLAHATAVTDLAAGIEIEKKAIALSTDEPTKAELGKALAALEARATKK